MPLLMGQQKECVMASWMELPMALPQAAGWEWGMAPQMARQMSRQMASWMELLTALLMARRWQRGLELRTELLMVMLTERR